ncbi:YafY family transcriptional regulator [Algoriphagus sp. H41]|uniref:YafY family transcriptional regulator n=1 Tax=Algoriphagus oliviformis TaxID=2811231 RepID=A0ABS3C6Z7_9BACT|nr:YafY family protein [Algoriphagus oliviformis]MBN7812747.1 YafY family transcriptional regulator [Algoriphagus oliviformis]
MNRIDRLTAILTQLQSKRVTKAQEIADRFSISLRTVYRDVRALEEAGVPVIGEAGQGYSLVEGYRLPPVMFTQEEAQAMVVAEKIFEKLSDRSSSDHFHSAMLKIKSVLRSSEKDRIDQLSPLVAVFRNRNQLQLKGKDEHLRLILDALGAKKLLEMEYTTFDEEKTSTRTVESVGVYYAFEQWYMIAWCRLRRDYRTFRLDRIQRLRVLEESYSPTGHPTLKEYIDKVRASENLLQIVLAVPFPTEKYLREQKYNQGFVMEKRMDDHVEMTFMTSHLEGFVRWLVCLADQVRILAPFEAKERMKILAEEIRSNSQG